MDANLLGVDNRAVLGDIFRAAFGVAPVYITVPLGTQKVATIEGFYPEIQSELENPDELLLSNYGTPVIFPVKFIGGEYPIYDWYGKPSKREYADLWLPATTMCDFSRAKNIIKTNVLGANGTIKEIFGFDDWQIRIRTLCIADKNFTAMQYADRLQDWFEVTGGIKVQGSIFGMKEIYNIVLEDIDIKSVSGNPGVIPIELSACSNEPVEIFLS